MNDAEQSTRRILAKKSDGSRHGKDDNDNQSKLFIKSLYLYTFIYSFIPVSDQYTISQYKSKILFSITSKLHNPSFFFQTKRSFKRVSLMVYPPPPNPNPKMHARI